MNTSIDTNKFPLDLNNRFEQYKSTPALAFRDLPMGDYLISNYSSFKSKDNKDCIIMKLESLSKQKFEVFAPDRITNDILNCTDNVKFRWLRNEGLKTSSKTGNQYFSYQLA